MRSPSPSLPGDAAFGVEDVTIPGEGRASRPSSRIVTRGIDYRSSVRLADVGVGEAVEARVELTLPDDSRHEGSVTLVRDADGYRTLGDAPKDWISAGLMEVLAELDQASFERACMRLWLAALDVVPVLGPP